MSGNKSVALTFGEVSDLFRSDEDFYFLCSASGRVLFTAGSLKLFLENDLTPIAFSGICINAADEVDVFCFHYFVFFRAMI